LVYETYTKEVAEFAVDSLDVDWKEQAYLMAKAYLDHTSFSIGSLTEQLEFEKFTTSQAEYRATKAYKEQ
jgi:hypothetical protein